MDGLAEETPLSHSLDMVASEVEDLVGLGERLQALIARLVSAGGLPEVATLIEAQAADLMSQRLTGLGAFVRALSAAAPVHVAADVEAALSALTLTEQARRLRGRQPAAAAAADAADEMFWD